MARRHNFLTQFWRRNSVSIALNETFIVRRAKRAAGMQIFLINLVRRPDRLRVMTEQLRSMGLAFHRVPAVDAKIVSDAWLAQHFAARGTLGAVSKGDKCCALSHKCAWMAFLSSGEQFGLILEDDVLLDHTAHDLLRRTNWIPPSVDLLKLEHFGPNEQLVLIGKPIDVGPNRSVSRIYSRHSGAGAYIITRAAAQTLISATATWALSVDHMMFNPNASPVIEALKPYQLLPVIARQTSELGGASDIRAWRAVHRRLGWAYLKRKVVRVYYELRLLPQQIARLVSRRGRLVRVQNEAFVPVLSRRAFEDEQPSQRRPNAAR